MSILAGLPEGSKVCLIRLRSLGDCVLTTPAIQLLHATRPDLQIAVVVEDRFREVFEGNPAVAKILPPAWSAVRSWRPRLCLNLHGGSRSFWMTLLSGAKWRAGFAHHNFTFAYNFKIGRAQHILGVRRTVHTAEHLASAMFALGVPISEIPQAQLFAQPSTQEGRYAVIHPFASSPEKTWPAARFAEFARYLNLWKIEPIIVAGPGDDTSVFTGQKVFSRSLTELKSLLSGATLFVGNDSGPAHIAAAFSVPSIVLFGPSKPAIWGPWQTESEVIVEQSGLANLPVSRVVAAVEKLLLLEEAHA